MATYEYSIEDPDGSIYDIISPSEMSVNDLNAEVEKLKRLNTAGAGGQPYPDVPEAPSSDFTRTAAPVAPPKQAQLTPPRDDTFIGDAGKTGYGDIVARRVLENIQSFKNVPSNAMDVISGEGPNGRIASAMETVHGVFSPFSMALTPLTGGVEKTLLSTTDLDPKIARDIGDLSEIPVSFLFGGMAGAGKFGLHAQKWAKTLGFDRYAGLNFADEVVNNPQLRWAAVRDQQPLPSDKAIGKTPIEQLARMPDMSIDELAMKANKPQLASIALKQRKAENELYLARLRNGQPELAGAMPEPPNFKYKDYFEFGPNEGKDLGAIAAIGSPSNVAPKLTPHGAAAIFEINQTERAIGVAKQVRGERVVNAIGGRGSETLFKGVQARIAQRNSKKTIDDVMKDPAIPQDVKDVVKFIDDKVKVDDAIIRPRLRAIIRPKIERQARAELARGNKAWKKPGIPAGSEIDKRVLNREVDKRVKEAVPDDWSLEDHFAALLPGEYQIRHKDGRILATMHSGFDAKVAIHDAVKLDPSLKVADIFVKHKVLLDAGFVRDMRGRVLKMFNDLANDTVIDVAAAAKGDFTAKRSSNFFRALLEGGPAGPGYNRDLIKFFEVWDSQLEKLIQMTDLQVRIAPFMQQMLARGQRQLHDALGDAARSIWGYRSNVSVMFDNTIANSLPAISKSVAPYALDRWAAAYKNFVVTTYLKVNPRYHFNNSMQTAQTLWPVADNVDMVRGIELYWSKEGKEILQRHGIFGPQSKVADVPISNIHSKFEKVTSIPELYNQQTAFLIMYDKARRLGLDDAAAAAYGTLRGQIYTQFLGLTSDAPIWFRRADPMGLVTLFKRFEVKNAELMMDIIRAKDFPAGAKWLATNFVLGGLRANTLGQSGWLTYKTWYEVKQTYGEGMANFIHSGLPGLIGIDMSNSVMFLNMPYGESLAAKVGNVVLGVLGSTAMSIFGAAAQSQSAEPSATKRALKALIDSNPAGRQVDAIARLIDGDYELTTPTGRLKYIADAKTLMKRMMGAKPLEESLLDSWAKAQMELKQRRDGVINYVASRQGQARIAGTSLGPDLERAMQHEIDTWNSMWPDARITPDNIRTRAAAITKSGMMDMQERIRRSTPKAIRDMPMFKDFQLRRGGG